MGLGTDIGGSIRVPAAFCGIAGLKPTVHRWSNIRSHTAVKGQELIRGQIGPMARTTEDLDLFMRALSPAEMSASDPYVPPLPYTPMAKVKLKKMRVGFYEHDGFLAPAASVRRAVREAGDALEAAGVELVPYEPPNVEELVYLYFEIMSADGQAAVRRLIGSDEVMQGLSTLWRVGRLPVHLRRALGKTLGRVGEARIGRLMRAAGERSVDELFALATRRAALRVEEMERWEKAGIEALLTPVYVTPAAPIGMAHDFTLGFVNVARYNVLDLPAGSVPVTRVRDDELVRDVKGRKDRLEKRAAAIESASRGMPVGVQVVAKPYQEHVALALMAAIEAEARQKPEFPKTPVPV
jgi:fatty acid amide hydrolase